MNALGDVPLARCEHYSGRLQEHHFCSYCMRLMCGYCASIHFPLRHPDEDKKIREDDSKRGIYLWPKKLL
jgi:hypothetical protein